MRIDHASGGYAFTPSDLRFASGGVVALPGMAIDHATFTDVVPLQEGFELVRQHLDRVGRPLTALCGFELRIPAALPWGQFGSFNERYFDRLRSWNLLRDDGSSPLARYSGHDIAHAVKRRLLAAVGVTPTHGLVWHDAAPPVLDVELEIDVRRSHRELILWPATESGN